MQDKERYEKQIEKHKILISPALGKETNTKAKKIVAGRQT